MSDNIAKKMAELLNKLPPPRTGSLLEPVEICACGKKVPIKLLKQINTGIKTCISDICKNCPNGEKIDKETAKVVCCRCGRVLFRLEPGEDPIDGFIIKAGTSLHLASCPICDNYTDTSKGKAYDIIEKIIWHKKKDKKKKIIAK